MSWGAGIGLAGQIRRRHVRHRGTNCVDERAQQASLIQRASRLAASGRRPPAYEPADMWQRRAQGRRRRHRRLSPSRRLLMGEQVGGA